MAEKYIRELGQIKKDAATVKRWSKERKEEQMRRLTVRGLVLEVFAFLSSELIAPARGSLRVLEQPLGGQTVD